MVLDPALAQLNFHHGMQTLEFSTMHLIVLFNLPHYSGIQPCVRKSSWYNQKVWANVLQTVLPQQCKGNWLHQVPLNLDKGCATISEST
ncbi:hypothetical protein SASPL_119646 [Salvia splendens]|uniref:Uncharacterized protein n=1 Tax=Salvia splendens TaxID=180675 RepID=A0A8X8XTX3_SALSN|nr:hypothetical protein SASPL_119646 [Salvia splendens]